MDRHPFEVLMDKGGSKKWPIMIHFDLTYECNLNCIHCYVVRQNKKELTSDEIQYILFQLAKANGFFLTLSGGEIFLRRDLFEILSVAHKLNFRTVVLSNGTLITRRVARFLKRFNIAEIQISIYSTDPEMHDKITRTRFSFKKTLEGINLLLQEGIRVVIKTPLMKDTFDEYRKIKLFADKLGVDYIFGPEILPKMNFDKTPTNLSPTLHQIEELYLDNSALRNDLEAIRKRAEEYTLNSNLNKPICGAGYNRCYISPYGDVSPCSTLLMKVGNLRQNNFSKIWEGSSALNRIRNFTLRMLKECIECDLLPYCTPCPGMGYQGRGDLFKPYKLHCRVAEAKYKAIDRKYYLGGEKRK